MLRIGTLGLAGLLGTTVLRRLRSSMVAIWWKAF